jgi:LmbE family N-acetylglucosaminyl deacetylase
MKILTIFAHPDDETMFAGGTLALLTRSGAQMHYLAATRGQGGETGEPPVALQAQLGLYRERELACAIQALGGGDLTFLDYIDPIIGADQELYPYTQDFDGLVNVIQKHIQAIQPHSVITHGTNGEYGHPGHILTHKAVCHAIQELGDEAPSLYSFSATYPHHPRPRHANQDDPAHLILDITPALDAKIRAAYCHRSQNALFTRRRSQQAGYQLTIPEILLKVESLHRIYPPVDGPLGDDLARSLAPWTRT